MEIYSMHRRVARQGVRDRLYSVGEMGFGTSSRVLMRKGSCPLRGSWMTPCVPSGLPPEKRESAVNKGRPFPKGCKIKIG